MSSSCPTANQSKSNLENLPSEILLVILGYLDVRQILSLRQTCTSLAELTRDRTIWLGLLENQNVFPLPSQYYLPGSSRLSSPILQLSSSSIEELVVSNILVDDLWLVSRQSDPVKLSGVLGGQENEEIIRDEGRPMRQGVILMGLEVFLDRWVLGVYADGWLNIWDANAFIGSGQDLNTGLATDEGWYSCHVISGAGQDRLTSYTATLDARKERILIALTRLQLRSNLRTLLVYEVTISSQSPNSCLKPVFRLIGTYESSTSYSLRHIDPLQGVVSSSHLCSVEVMYIPSLCTSSEENENQGKPEKIRIATQCDELEEMYTTVVSVQVIDPYLFVFKTRSVELHPIPRKDHQDEHSSPSLSLPVLRHNFPRYNFREAHISDVRCCTSSSLCSVKDDANEDIHARTTNTTYTLSIFASDVIQGLFYFCATVTVPSMSSYDAEPMLDVHLRAVYAMTSNIPVRQKTRKRKQNTSNSMPSKQRSSSSNTTPTFSPGLSRPNRSILCARYQDTNLSHTFLNPVIQLQRSDSPTLPHAVFNPNPHTVRDASFVSTYTMGSQGMRAIWIERRRATTVKRVVGCRLSNFDEWDEQSESDDAESEANPARDAPDPVLERLRNEAAENSDGIATDSLLPVPLEGKAIYSFQSYDLREDLTHCALGEASGIIVLGNRSGDVFLLDIGA